MKPKHNYEQKAYYIWKVLTANPQTITYKQLGENKNINLHHRVIRHALGYIYRYCYDNNIPMLTMLVVRHDTQKPGWEEVSGTSQQLIKVQEYYKNNELPNPFDYAKDGDGGALQSQIIKDILSSTKKGNVKEVFAKYFANGRPHQSIFRNTLLQVYGEQCAFCGLTFEDALEACHIVPYVECDKEQQIDPQNGILLCATHHKLFDEGLFTIDENYNIQYTGNKSECRRKADAQIIKVGTIKYDDKKYKHCLQSIKNIKQRNEH